MSKNKSSKIKIKNSVDDESDSLVSPCFQIGQDAELKEIPTNGEEYLLKVIKERENFSVVTKCTKDYSMFAKNQSCFVKEIPQLRGPDKFHPTIEWQNMQVADFSDTRMYISRMTSKKLSNNLKTVEIDPNNLIGWKRFFNTNNATLSCVLSLKQSLLDEGLECLIRILNQIKPGETISHKTGQWIYAFLACTRLPLLSDTTSILRSLARKCAEIRSNINPDDSDAPHAVAPLNIFICLISRYFRQYDLADT